MDETNYIGSMDYLIYKLYWKELAYNISFNDTWYHLIKNNECDTYELGNLKEEEDGFLFRSVFRVELYSHLEPLEPIGFGNFRKCSDSKKELKISSEWYTKNDEGRKIANIVYSYLTGTLKLKIESK